MLLDAVRPIRTTVAHPTTPSDVTPDTALDALNLNWRERDMPERARTKHVHRLHPYLGKFIPQLVEIFLRKYFAPGETVLDPFCGSGTTLVQANELGINAVGYDISAFNVLLCRAKTGVYDLRRVRLEVLDILERVRGACIDAARPSLWGGMLQNDARMETDDIYLNTWFAPTALRQLMTYRHFVEVGGYVYQDLLKVILSRSARSARLTTHFELDFPKRPQTEPYWCYKHSRECVPTADAFKFLLRYSLDTLKRLEEFASVRTEAAISVRHSDSRTEPIPAHHGVVTSPPYVGLIDYHDQHAYAYHLLGLEDQRGSEIGPAVNGAGLATRQRYQRDIAQVFKRAVDSMSPSGRLIVVANDRADLYGEIASMVGVKIEAVVQRHVNRRTGMRSTDFYESVFIWRKPHG